MVRKPDAAGQQYLFGIPFDPEENIVQEVMDETRPGSPDAVRRALKTCTPEERKRYEEYGRKLQSLDGIGLLEYAIAEGFTTKKQETEALRVYIELDLHAAEEGGRSMQWRGKEHLHFINTVRRNAYSKLLREAICARTTPGEIRTQQELRIREGREDFQKRILTMFSAARKTSGK